MPKILRVPAVGVDVSDTTIKIVELERDRKGIHLKKFADKKIAPGIVEAGEIKKPKELAKALAEIRKKYNITSAHASLPEERAYLFEATFARLGEQNLRDIIEFHLEENVPISPAEAVFDYDVIEVMSGGKVRVGVSVMPIELVEKYSEAFRGADIWLESLEVEAQSIVRSVIPETDNVAHMVADFGRTRTGVAIASERIVRFTSTIEVGGDHLTDVLVKGLGISNRADAEKLKEDNGLHQEQESVNENLLKVLGNFKDELERHMRFWETHHHAKHNKVEKVVLCGGNATVPGVREYLSSKLGVSVVVPDVWMNVLDINEELPPIRKGDSLSFATAIGLALKTLKD